MPIKEQILQEVDKLSPAQQAQLLHIVRHMQQPQTPVGTPGEIMLADLARYEFAPGALAEMLSAIEEEAERIDWDGWQ